MKLLNRNNLEIRKAYFLQAFNRDMEEMAIISFGGCNFHCPYCKRDCQYIDSEGNVIKTRNVSMATLKEMIDKECSKNRRVRLSGGDPSVYPKESLEIAKYVKENYNSKISIAHNGSNYNYVKSMIEYLDYIAMDYKAFYEENIERITGVNNPKMYQKEILALCEVNNVIVDVRTPIFADTTIEELREIAKELKHYTNVFWTLRKYNEVKGCDFKVPTMEYVTELAEQLSKEFNIKIGTRNYWKGGFEIF